ncbi:tail needle knob protein [Yersinia enterocolitica]|uniref:tail needle knob protein n=1 Tax=Yersinia enterocolitica TaxID=630 RepID=UPI002AC6803B|nr:hypothetical protein [Yersinia enterocolitica]HEN3465057.1 hypothetical protein [Yersinia enterocolitica]
MADDNLNVPVIVQATRIDATLLPKIFSQPYFLYVVQQGTDLGSVAGKANEAGQGAWDAQVKNDEQDVILADHEVRLDAAEATLVNHETRITAAEATLANHEARITSAETTIALHTTQLGNHETRITTLETNFTAYQAYMNRQKSEVVYSGVSLVIPTTSTNLLTLLGTLTPTSGTLLPFFDVAAGRLKALNKFKNLSFKINLRGTYTSSSGNRSMQITFGTVVPDTIVVSRDAATSIDDVFINTFFAVDEGDDIVSPGITMMIKANGSTFTATQIKIIATQ